MTLEEEIAYAHYPIYVRPELTLKKAVKEVQRWKPDFAVRYRKIVSKRLEEALIHPNAYIRSVAKEVIDANQK